MQPRLLVALALSMDWRWSKPHQQPNSYVRRRNQQRCLLPRRQFIPTHLEVQVFASVVHGHLSSASRIIFVAEALVCKLLHCEASIHQGTSLTILAVNHVLGPNEESRANFWVSHTATQTNQHQQRSRHQSHRIRQYLAGRDAEQKLEGVSLHCLRRLEVDS